MANETDLRFQPFQSVTDVSFWHEFAQRKINEYKLSEAPLEVVASYAPSRSANIPARISLRNGALNGETATETFSPSECEARGKLINCNTVEAFKNTDKKSLLDNATSVLLEQVNDGSAEKNPALLASFQVLSFADLKKHHYLYWFSFPTLAPSSPFQLVRPPKLASEAMSPSDLLGALQGIQQLRSSSKKPSRDGFFLGVSSSEPSTQVAQVFHLDAWQKLSEDQKGRVFLIFIDPCGLDSSPGWPLRNFLYLAFFKWGIETARVFCLREALGPGKLALAVALAEKYKENPNVEGVRSLCTTSMFLEVNLPGGTANGRAPIVAGWERNAQGKMGPKLLNLSSQLDPTKLAESACDLNLRLMRWRALPELDVGMLSTTKCLLLGAGTLGCAVGRSLLGWGFKHITFVDNGKVSYSNPVRQSLFNFEDCLEGGKHKAIAAAEALKRIFPGVETKGIHLSIPMPGHMVSSEEATKDTLKDVDILENLIQAHDVVMLLTDTRESRWLPTLLGAKYNKIVLNAALGFDSFLVMRHGAPVAVESVTPVAAESGAPDVVESKSGNSNSLGCYFCNDVVAPQNSMKDRTLDQQCTVTRPGLAPMASALLVELLVGILHHPLGNRAVAATQNGTQPDFPESKLGCLPHQIRGYLPSFSTTLVSGPRFPQCTACSSRIVDQYNHEMLVNVFNNPEILEDLTGLRELQESMENDGMDFDCDEWSDEE